METKDYVNFEDGSVHFIGSRTILYWNNYFYDMSDGRITTEGNLRDRFARKNLGLTNKKVHPYDKHEEVSIGHN